MEQKKIILEVENLLNESEGLISQGKIAEASIKISVAKDKLRPIGSGTNGPRPKE